MNWIEKRTKKPILCFLILSHYSHTMGGVETQAKLVIDALIKKNQYDVYYICRNLDPNFIPNGYKVMKIGNRLGKYFQFFDSLSIYKTLRRIKPDIIYQNGGSCYAGVAAFYARRYGVRFIWHIASDRNVEPRDPKRIVNFLRGSVDQIMVNYGIHNADIIVGQNRYQDSILRKYYKRKCDVFIPPGHPLPRGNIEKYENLTVLWIGNLRPLKRPDLFVELAQQFVDRTDIDFVMIGGFVGSMEKYKSILQKIEATPNMHYLGQISQEAVNQQLSKSHILVNTSEYEGFPNTFIQAWLREVPVVSLNVDPDSILLRHSIGIHSKKFERLVKDVSMLTENELCRVQMGKHASQYARKNHSSSVMIASLTNLFRI